MAKWGPPPSPLLWSHAMFLTLDHELDALMPARLQLIARTGHPDFLDLPWDQPLEEWTHERLVEVVRGIHRHVVRFVEYEGGWGRSSTRSRSCPVELAQREYRLLRALAADEMPVVDAVGVVSERGGDLDAC